MRKIKKNKDKGILFWITGLSGSGKTTLAKKIKKDVAKLYGPTLLVSGDNLRKIFNFTKYSQNERISLSKKFCKFAKFITDQKINLIFAVVGMMHSTRKWYSDNIDNYVEIYVKADLNKIIKLKKKKIYSKKNIGDVVGVTIKPEFPKNPNIIIKNDLKVSTDVLANTLVKKIKKII